MLFARSRTVTRQRRNLFAFSAFAAWGRSMFRRGESVRVLQKRYVMRPGWEIVFKPSPEGMPGVTEPAHVRVNELGLRGDLPTAGAKPAILVLGSSTTQDIALNDCDMWTGRLQAELRRRDISAWVGNAGKAGTHSLHHAMQIEELLPRFQRLSRVLVLAGLTDMLFNVRIHIGDTTLAEDWDLRQAFSSTPSVPLRARLRQVLSREGEDKLRIVDYGAMMASYKLRRTQVAPDDFITSPPDISEELAQYRGRLERIADIVRRHGVALTLITQPVLWKPEMSAEEQSLLYAGGVAPVESWHTDKRIKWYSVQAMSEMMDAYNAITRDVCRAQNLICVDLARVLPKKATYFYDDFHFSRAGAEEIGKIVARAIAA